ncbi:hypothetical protein M9H77_12024 [Catharanthus roseus]|uniref:Uncharacterized protein n=1 Tax=Catharanthus roseus TaxID=4058 RepID=A0ACC0BG60_CATRO|nr:hypothetical protein M9H77_12024 [Catharanthus roseus]
MEIWFESLRKDILVPRGTQIPYSAAVNLVAGLGVSKESQSSNFLLFKKIERPLSKTGRPKKKGSLKKHYKKSLSQALLVNYTYRNMELKQLNYETPIAYDFNN